MNGVVDFSRGGNGGFVAILEIPRARTTQTERGAERAAYETTAAGRR
jgi:hypothetical protein